MGGEWSFDENDNVEVSFSRQGDKFSISKYTFELSEDRYEMTQIDPPDDNPIVATFSMWPYDFAPLENAPTIKGRIIGVWKWSNPIQVMGKRGKMENSEELSSVHLMPCGVILKSKRVFGTWRFIEEMRLEIRKDNINYIMCLTENLKRMNSESHQKVYAKYKKK